MTTLSGHLEHITYRNPENQFTIARFRCRQTHQSLTIIGYLAGAAPGDALRLTGRWETHRRYGNQFRVTQFEVRLPTAVGAMRKYLASGFIPGIGSKTADRIVDYFGDRTFEVIENDASQLTAVKGIGVKTAKRIGAAWRAHHFVRRLIQFLQDNGIDTAYSGRILKAFGEDALQVVEDEPYRLAMEIPTVGFQIADRLALNRGMDPNDPERVQSCLHHQLRQQIAAGHTYGDAQNLLQRTCQDFQVDLISAEVGMDQLVRNGEAVQEHEWPDAPAGVIYPADLHRAEVGIASRLQALQTVAGPSPAPMDAKIQDQIFKKLALQLSKEQQNVLEAILNHRVAIITGGPGTGKTTLIRSLMAVYKMQNQTVALAAPTGRAAKRLAQIAGQPAKTIHRLLRYNIQSGDFDKNRDDPLDAGAIIVDEASMIDTQLMYHLLEAIPFQAVLVLVGDVFQLPSVGPGNVLADLIRSQQVPTYELTTIFRQAQSSPIITNAHRIRAGRMPHLEADTKTLSDFYFFATTSPTAAAATIVELCSHRIPEKFVLDAMADIQVITPMHKGEVGTIQLNQKLQQALNPVDPETADQRIRSYRLGDKVMHLRNDYQKEVYNGDIGTVCAIASEEGRLTVAYDGRKVAYDAGELDDLSLAYAISVHKSQGSEYPAVIVPIMTQHYVLLQRNLLYTALTRARRLVVVVGTRRAIEIALNNDKPMQRLSGLAVRMRRPGGRIAF